MATITQSVQGGFESGTSTTVSGLTYKTGDVILVAIVTTSSGSVKDSGLYDYTRIVFVTTPAAMAGRVMMRTATNDATNTTLTVSNTSSCALSFITMIVRPDAGKQITLKSTNYVSGSGTTASLSMPGDMTTQSVIFGVQAVADDVFFTDSDTTNGAWSSVFSRTSSGVDRAIATQWKQPTAAGTQTYNGTYASSESWGLMGVHLLETDFGFWGVRA